ncbi:uncharacterized protein LOC122503229 [Leptopilina heterotoma]|uniref:uncharacterized protein LOC122499188 n=1 Tax=Leptopilina heterotoma TaxID=63436 RepID=UPI001CAA29E7|nr:uncharacterized protein LOC122499188 [Leptopilina heterotoma]XP_043469632.1 uncharacterized protein LOC122503228 [Leptopilina heterotoma]XP_043469633.1 uncharacterized protein LOC122503229 [Leptopilina heterotoma]
MSGTKRRIFINGVVISENNELVREGDKILCEVKDLDDNYIYQAYLNEKSVMEWQNKILHADKSEDNLAKGDSGPCETVAKMSRIKSNVDSNMKGEEAGPSGIADFEISRSRSKKRPHDCDESDGQSVASLTKGELQWTPQMVQFFIDAYKELEEKKAGKFIRIRAFNSIAKRFKEELNMNLTAQQLESKLKGLQNTYKNQLLMKKQTGGGRNDWQHFEVMNEFMYKKPQITPVSTTSNLNGFKPKESSQSDSDSSIEGKQKSKKTKGKRRKRQSSPTFQQKMVNLIGGHHEKQEKSLEKFNNTFERYVNILDGMKK